MRAFHPVAAIAAIALLGLSAACSSNHDTSSDAGGAAGTPSAGGQAGSNAHGGNGGTAGGCPGDPNLPLMDTPPAKLSETGLYDASGQIAPWVQTFEPQYKLWSDGAEKLRYIYVPKCAQIDTSDMDHWNFPVGTRAWKQFTVNGTRVETRLIHKNGTGPADWIFVAYQWDDTDTDADAVPNGVIDAKGTTHDIPSTNDCVQCHGKLSERLLGFSAIQLTHTDGTITGASIQSLSDAGTLTVPAPNGFTIPGVAQSTRDAIGYLHANCGNCHNSSFATLDLRMRVLTGQTTVADTDVYTTAVNVPTAQFNCSCNRITPGDPSQSAIFQRMSSRVATTQMPPLGTEVADTNGIDIVSAWITDLGQAGGGL